MANLNSAYATLAFANIFKPRPRAEGGEAVYSCVLLFDPAAQKSDAHKKLQDACVAAAREEFGATVPLKSVIMPFRDAGEKQYDGFHAGHTYVNCWSKQKPGVVDVNRQDILAPEEVWSGQLVRANLTPFAWSHSGRKGVSLGLNALQIIQSHGRERLDGRQQASKAFDDGLVTADASDDTPF